MYKIIAVLIAGLFSLTAFAAADSSLTEAAQDKSTTPAHHKMIHKAAPKKAHKMSHKATAKKVDEAKPADASK
ncbi:MAG TPA: hypothetical protein VIE65_17500 [Methylobacter sp.]|jgi:hypothetical protein